MMPSSLAVSGAARGIGLAVARLAARAGAGVALLDRDGGALERAVAALRNDDGANVMAFPCDVSDEASVTEAIDSAAEQLGPTQGLVTAAGVDRGGALHELDPDEWDDVLGVNLRGTFLACRAALRHMLPAGGGSIVCMSSPFAFAAAPGGIGAYAASKGGVSALVRSLAVDYGAHGIRVNAVLPGPTETELMWANVPADRVADVRATVRREVPLGRLAEADEPARAACWLLSSESSYVTGSQLVCDGGVLAKASISV
jgi:NAD(P)-dependent dehydrogenase (short-subunit alcohol dehydrogenase family)